MDGSGKTTLLEAAAGEITLSKLKLAELIRLEKRSLFVILWGWISGSACLAATIWLLWFARVAVGMRLFLAPLLVLFGLSDFYVYTRCRTKAARHLIKFNSILILALVLICLLTAIIGRGGGYYGFYVLALVFFIMAIFTFGATRAKVLWGKVHFSHSAIRSACARKAAGKDIADITPVRHTKTLPDVVFTALGVAVRVTAVLFAAVYISSRISGDWIRIAAKLGDAGMQNALGERYAEGREMAVDPVKAAYWFRKAAEQGHAGAQNNLALCYFSGQGVNKDLQQAAYWFRKAAEQGHAGAQNNLGLCYVHEQGVKKDYEQAVYWFRKAAEQGYAKGQYCLGECYLNGKGVKEDSQQAEQWFRKAAEQGYEPAAKELKLLDLVREGKALLDQKNYPEAKKLLLEAAEQGSVKARWPLATCCFRMGDLNEAQRWLCYDGKKVPTAK